MIRFYSQNIQTVLSASGHSVYAQHHAGDIGRFFGSQEYKSVGNVFRLSQTAQDFFPFVKLCLDFLGDLRRKLRVRQLYLRLILAGDDPCDLAVNYGKTWTAVGNLLPVLERWFVIKKKDVEVECDFTASETLVVARLEITMTLGRLLSLAAVYAVRGLKEFIVFRNKRKGGACK